MTWCLLPRMALEAAAMGCAVIVCDDRGFAGMLSSRNLFQFPGDL